VAGGHEPVSVPVEVGSGETESVTMRIGGVAPDPAQPGPGQGGMAQPGQGDPAQAGPGADGLGSAGVGAGWEANGVTPDLGTLHSRD
jgi:hypothetical protein